MNIRIATSKDSEPISKLLASVNDDNTSAEYLNSWYWKNPFKSCSIAICEEDGEIEGVATTNNLQMLINGQKKLVAFPQKIATSSKIRGKGYYTKLYTKNEEDNYDTHKVDYLMAFSNHISTPLYKKKFSYKIASSPIIAFLAPRLFLGMHKTSYKEVVDFDFEYLNTQDLLQQGNAIIKEAAYIKWRYNINADHAFYTKLEVKKGEQILGYAVVKKAFKKKVPFLYLLDVITNNKANVSIILRAARNFAARKLTTGVLLFKNDKMNDGITGTFLKFILKNKLNFIVKGVNDQESEQLVNTQFNFDFGDLDFM